MRSIGLLLKKSFRFLVKLTLVAIPAVVAASCAYRQALKETRREALENYREYVAVLGDTASKMEQQGRIIEQLKGEMNVLKLLAVSRTAAGLPVFPQIEPTPAGSTLTLQTPTPTSIRRR